MSTARAIRPQRGPAAAKVGARGQAAVQRAPASGAGGGVPLGHAAPAIGLPGLAVQTKVAVGAPSDPFEREADRAATAVVEGGAMPQLSPVPAAPGGMAAGGPTFGLQRMAAGTCPACGGAASATETAADPTVQLSAEEPAQAAEQPVQMAEADQLIQPALADEPVQTADLRPAGGAAPDMAPARAARAEPAIRNPSPGSPMHAGTRVAIESRMGLDLGGVRVHDGAADRRTGAALGARAFTHGNHIWLGPGEGQTDLGLMAHESAHVVQQGAAGGARPARAAAAPAPAPGTPLAVSRAPAETAGRPRPGAEAPGRPPGGAAAGAPAGGGGPAGAGVAGAGGDGLLMPEPRTGLTAEDRARLGEVGDAAGTAAEAYQTLPPAEQGVAEAQGAVTIPAEETEARAEAALAAELGARPEPSPEIDQLCARILEVIHARQPPDEASLIESDPQEEAEAAGAVLEGAVEGDAERVSADYAALGEEPAAEPAPEPEPIEAPPASVEAPGIGAAAAVPAPIETEGALDADVEANAERIREAGMETEPAREAAGTGEGPIAEAMEAQGELAQTAARDPAEVMAEQAAARESAAADMAALQARALETLQGSRSQTIGGVGGQQQGMVGSEEQMRAQVSGQAQRIFEGARDQVESLLEPLPDLAMRRWQTGVQVLSTRFDNDLAEVQRWLDERYSGVGGALTELADDVFGKPAWVTRAYNRAEERFAEGVCDLIREISTEINGIVATCERLIEDADSQIAALFDALPESLRDWAEGERARMQESLDGLTARAHAARDDLTRNLAREAASTVQQARERVHALREAAKGLVGRIADAVAAFAEDPARFIIDGLLELAGIPPASFWALVDRIGQVIEDIADDPIGFANNLVTALGQGFQRFFDNFGRHILGGFFDWLFSGLGAVGVTIPSDFSLGSIITFALELMGITWARIRGVLARHIGEENVALLEKAYELIATLIEQGPEGIFELIREQLNPQAILDQILQAAVDYLIEALIRAVTPRIIALFNPAGAIVQAVEVIYRVLAWIFEHAARIFSLVETVVNGAADLIAGNVSGMATAVEGALGRLLAPVIDFLAGFLGLGSLPDRIADTIRGFQDMILGVIDRVVAWLAQRARGLLRALGIGGEDEGEDERTDREKEADLERAIGAAEDSLEQRQRPSEVQEELPEIKRRYRLSVLELRRRENGSHFVYGEVNPHRETKDRTFQIGGLDMTGEEIMRMIRRVAEDLYESEEGREAQALIAASQEDVVLSGRRLPQRETRLPELGAAQVGRVRQERENMATDPLRRGQVTSHQIGTNVDESALRSEAQMSTFAAPGMAPRARDVGAYLPDPSRLEHVALSTQLQAIQQRFSERGKDPAAVPLIIQSFMLTRRMPRFVTPEEGALIARAADLMFTIEGQRSPASLVTGAMVLDVAASEEDPARARAGRPLTMEEHLARFPMQPIGAAAASDQLNRDLGFGQFARPGAREHADYDELSPQQRAAYREMEAREVQLAIDWVQTLMAEVGQDSFADRDELEAFMRTHIRRFYRMND